MEFTGASWNKWDLHFHTPSSYDYKHKSSSNKDIIDVLVQKEVKVIAITDHHFIDIERIKELQVLGKGKVTVLPGIEFLSDARGKEPVHFIGIFSEDCDIEYIWGQIKNKTKISEIKKGGKTQNQVYCHLEDTFNLIHELGGIVTIHAGDKTNSIENITHSLPHGTAQKTEIAHKVDVYELGKETDQEGYIKVVFPTIKKRLPMIICSDNHDIRKYSVKQNLWIKAIPSFEGLKQIIYEPETRVYIGENKPKGPLRTIKSLEISFPKETTIIHREDKSSIENENIFCFGFKGKITFSPYFTCVIGGRGSGKSTILSLIAEKALGETPFFENNLLRFEGKGLNPKEYVDIEGTHDIEFISQNQIEKYANNEELTEAIYDRMFHREYDLFNHLETLNEDGINKIESQIESINLHSEVQIKIHRLRVELEESRKIVNHYDNPQYKALTKAIEIAANNRNEVIKSRNKYLSLIAKLKELKDDFTVSKISNEYDNEINEITKTLETLSQPKSLPKAEQDIINFGNLLSQKTQELDVYMKSQGVSQEDTSEYERAVSSIPNLELEIEEEVLKLQGLESEIKEFDSSKNSLTNDRENFETKISETLLPLNERLKGFDKNVADIRFEYRFDKEKAINNLLDGFERVFKDFRPSQHSTRKDAVRDYLFCISPWEVDDYETYLKKLDDYGNNANAKEFIRSIFKKKVNFETYKLIILKIRNDIIEHKKIIGFYDNKEFKNCSFGQKCTAVIVALLTFGVKPIIVDEPEAHLDSKLIAEYLVKLIKNKKVHRQIIFATHNANFVINGDAELIHCLEVGEDNLTKITSTTIEDKQNRDKLLALEGGEEAFTLRDKKLLK